MAELKTKLTKASPKAFIDSVEDVTKRKDSKMLLALFQSVTGEKPKMWGESGIGPRRKDAGTTAPSRGSASFQQETMRAGIIGYGSYKYISNKKEFEWPLTGFSPRKQNLTLYLMIGVADYSNILTKLGKHKTGKGCLYINKLEDIDMKVLERLIKKTYETFKKVSAKMYKEREATVSKKKPKNS